MRDLRSALGKKLWLTLASVGSAQYIDFKSCVQYLNMVNVMAYDMGSAPKHHSALYRSGIVGWLCASDAVEAHRKAGVPDEKIVLGMPFYGRGKEGQYMKYRDRDKQKLKEAWHNVSKASCLKDENGELAIGFESPRSIAMKCAYIKEQGLRGAMYWEYADDNDRGDLQRAVWQGVLQNDKDKSKASQKAAKRLAAVLTENQGRMTRRLGPSIVLRWLTCLSAMPGVRSAMTARQRAIRTACRSGLTMNTDVIRPTSMLRRCKMSRRFMPLSLLTQSL